ncbi:prepilin peptidase [Elusimicrobiota bacterium]
MIDIYILAGIIGLILGSFANVVIYRLPKGESPIKPLLSYCPNCGNKIPAIDNIPVLSFIALKGKCRKCENPISWRYPIIELALSLECILILWKLDTTGALGLVQVIAFVSFAFILTVITAIDFDTYTIPDIFSLGLLTGMLVFSPWNPLLGSTVTSRIISSLAGTLAGGAIFFLFAFIGEKIYKKEAMGGGDVKLAAAIGASLGVSSLYPTILISSAFGILYALPMLISGKLNRQDPIAYGPFLAIAAFLVFLAKGKIELFPIFIKNY